MRLWRSINLEGGNPSWKDVAASSVTSLGLYLVINIAKRRQLGIRVSIEPRNMLLNYRADAVNKAECKTEINEMARLFLPIRGQRPNYDIQWFIDEQWDPIHSSNPEGNEPMV